MIVVGAILGAFIGLVLFGGDSDDDKGEPGHGPGAGAAGRQERRS